jgi:hypothetical protein
MTDLTTIRNPQNSLPELEVNPQNSLAEPEVFLFCWYPDGWLPRAIIVDISKLDDEALNQMNTILAAGDLFENIWKKTVVNASSISLQRTGIKTYRETVMNDGSSFINCQSVTDNHLLMLYLDTWKNFTDNYNYFYSNAKDDISSTAKNDNISHSYWINNAHEYYINDENSNLSPVDLHKKLKLMKSLPTNYKQLKDNDIDIDTYKFNVKHCVMMSDIPIWVDATVDLSIYIKPLRFYYKYCDDVQRNKDYITTIISTHLNATEISICEGYGFFKPKTIQDWMDLNNKHFRIADVEFYIV